MTTLKLNTWIHPRTGETRRYSRNWEEVIGLETERYGSGNIRWASLNGETISNSRARQIEMKIWLDSSNDVHVDNFNGGRGTIEKADVIEAVKKVMQG